MRIENKRPFVGRLASVAFIVTVSMFLSNSALRADGNGSEVPLDKGLVNGAWCNATYSVCQGTFDQLLAGIQVYTNGTTYVIPQQEIKDWFETTLGCTMVAGGFKLATADAGTVPRRNQLYVGLALDRQIKLAVKKLTSSTSSGDPGNCSLTNVVILSPN